jgi:hypothetical protein
MLIAKQKLRENLAEYILYIWQLEDLLRALNFDSNAVRRTLVEPLEVSDEKKQEILYWYLSIIDLLREENKVLSGHHYHSLYLIGELNKLHLSLLNNNPRYILLYNAARDDIALFREKSDKEASDIEIAFDALYAKLLLKMKHEQIYAETLAAFDRITSMLAYLSAKFHEPVSK